MVEAAHGWRVAPLVRSVRHSTADPLEQPRGRDILARARDTVLRCVASCLRSSGVRKKGRGTTGLSVEA